MSVYSQVSSYSDYVDLQHYTGSGGDTGAGPQMSGAFWLSGSTLNDTTFYFNSGIETVGSITGETSLTIGDATLTEAELGYLDGITIGTAGASKALVLDAEKFIDGIEQLTASIMSASSIFCTDLTVHDATLTIGSTSISEAEAGFIDGVTAGTAAASKALVLDGNKDIGTIRNLTIDGTFSDGNYTFDTSGNVTSLGTVGCGAVTSTGAVQGTSLTASAGVSGGPFAAGTTVTAGTTMSASQGISARSLTVDTGLTIGCAADTDLLTLAANTLTVAGTANIGTAMSASTTLSGRSLTVDTGLTIGCAADTDLMTLTANTLTVAGTVNAGTAMSASTTLSGRSLTVDTGLTIGCAADTDLMTLTANTLTVAGAVNSTTLSASAGVSGGPGAFGTTVTAGTTMSASQGISGRSLTVDDGLTIGCAADTDLLTLSNGNVTFTGTTVIATADVNGGAIDAVTIGSNSACTALTVNGANAQSITSTGANNVSLTAGNNVEITANGTDAEDGITLQLGNATNTVFAVVNSDDDAMIEYTAAGVGEHNGDNMDADFKFHSDTSTDRIEFDAGDNALVVYDGNSETMRFGGDATTDYALDVKDGANAINKIRAAAFVTYSDERLKTDVVEMNNALKTVNSIKAVNFTWKKDGSQDFGFLAQDLKKVIPQAVHGTDDGLYGVDYGRLTSVLVKAIQEQSVQIKALQEKLDK